MKLIYIDEAGNTGTRVDDPMQPYHLVAALIVNDRDVRIIEDKIRMLGLKHFGSSSRHVDFEFHGYSMHKGKGNYFSGVSIEKRIEIVEDLINIIKSHNLHYIYIIIVKSKSSAEFLHPHQLAFVSLIQQLESYLRKNVDLGLLIADENHDIEQKLINDLEHLKYTGISWFDEKRLTVNHIIDSVHFVKSKNNPLIQLVDVIAYVLLRGKKVKDALMKEYQEKIAAEKFEMTFYEWVESHASLKNRTELKHFRLLTGSSNQGFSVSAADVETVQ